MDYPLDVLSAGQALQQEYPDLPIAVMGSSMGAAMSICALSHQEHPFQAAVLESSFPTLLHFWRRYPIPRMGIQLSMLLYPAGERRLRPVYAAEKLVGTPNILLIYGDADNFTPVKDGQLLWEVLQMRTYTEFWRVPNAEHTLACKASPREYSLRVTQFLDRQLKRSSEFAETRSTREIAALIPEEQI
ncbi:alpha/beta hydrolase family protein [Hahella ganghwensis]|uniref:alpha/beta hydrolase family protein n=1 Tax=Hahella ganghwensis TaxID=286420 RepID=UPI00035F4C86|nr:prolyl oligopeptidase family serine peptidase [Hahella ganghwensis]